MNQEYVIRGNDVLLRCGIPSHVQDLVDVVSWHDSSEAGDEFRYISSTSNGKAPICFLLAVIHQEFKVHVPLETYVIKGNDAIVKCEIPSFVGESRKDPPHKMKTIFLMSLTQSLPIFNKKVTRT